MARNPKQLTKREKEVLTLVADGYARREIVEKLNLSYYSVGAYKQRVMLKLELENKAALVRYAVNNNLFSSKPSVKEKKKLVKKITHSKISKNQKMIDEKRKIVESIAESINANLAHQANPAGFDAISGIKKLQF